MSQSIFKDHSDHDFYDKECKAHKVLKVSWLQPAGFGVECGLMSGAGDDEQSPHRGNDDCH